MKGIMMNELESAIVEWVSKNDKYLRGEVEDRLVVKGYPPNDVKHSMDKLLKTNTLKLVDGYVAFEWPADIDDYPAAVQRVLAERDGFEPQQISSSKTNDVQVPLDSAVHSPSHYTRGGMETIDFIEAKGLNFHLGNVVKYVSRAGFKRDAKIQDLEKALWYLNREVDRIKKQLGEV